MKVNQFIWDNYKSSEQGKKAIELYNIDTPEKLRKILKLNDYENNDELLQDKLLLIEDLYDFNIYKEYFERQDNLTNDFIVETILSKGIILKFDNSNIEVLFEDNNETYFLNFLEEISFWLHLTFPDVFIPYMYIQKFRYLKRICDAFNIKLPPEPKKRDKYKRAKYYVELCDIFYDFRIINKFTEAELNAFLYDFAPSYLEDNLNELLPEATQVWMVGGNLGGLDINFLENADKDSKSFWQGNLDTKKGDIIIMYCLSPVSAIHSIWRATEDGVIDPFFHFYSSIQIGHPVKIPNIPLKELKQHHYFKDNPKVRANMQGVNGYNLSSKDYKELLKLLSKDKGFNINKLPKLYKPEFDLNKSIKVEKDVELWLLEPLLIKIGYEKSDWERQFSLRMGVGERNYPDYVFNPINKRGYEASKMIVEAKFYIERNKDLEEAFIQALSYALRLQSLLIVLCDKNAIWIFPKTKNGFDRTNYIKKYWKELENVDDFNLVLNTIGKIKLSTL